MTSKEARQKIAQMTGVAGVTPRTAVDIAIAVNDLATSVHADCGEDLDERLEEWLSSLTEE